MFTALVYSMEAPLICYPAYSLEQLLRHIQGTADADPYTRNCTGAGPDYKNPAGPKLTGFRQLAHNHSSCL
ncbi:hypothetical protein D3C76_1609170 [compost metagenome]